MISPLLSGFLTGMLLQIAIGPVFFYILTIALQRTVADGWFAVLAVTLVDYLFILLAVLGVGKLLEKPKIKRALGITSSVVLVLFGLFMTLKLGHHEVDPLAAIAVESNYLSSFLSTFFLTLTSPLTIVFWTGLFAARAIEKGYTQKQLFYFGIAAGFATFVFLGGSVTLLSALRTSLPILLLKVLNIAVGLLLIAYGLIRLHRLLLANRGRTLSPDGP